MRKVGFWKRVRRDFRVRALLVFLPILSLLPHRTAVALGGALGSLAWYLLPRHRNVALRHLALAFPERTASWRRRIGRASFANLGRSALELCVARRTDLLGSVEMPPATFEVIRSAHAEGHGVLAFSCHLGNWELLARSIASAGLPVGTIAREANDPRLTAILEEGRRSTGIRSFWRGKAGAIRAIVEHLKAGGVLAALIDQDTDVAAHFVPFFGRLARTPRAPADLAVRYGTGAVLGHIHRVAPSVHRVVLQRLDMPQGTDAEERSRKLTEAATAAIEAAVREHPDEWVWMHERWRSQP
ncbi:MAG: lysophospholipid acyltransferase family protein [Myxococcales bacterium]